MSLPGLTQAIELTIPSIMVFRTPYEIQNTWRWLAMLCGVRVGHVLRSNVQCQARLIVRPPTTPGAGAPYANY